MNHNEKGDRSSRVLLVHSVPTLAEQIRTGVEIVAIIAAGLWALYVFVYEQRIKPLSEPPSFSLPTIIDQSATRNGIAFLTIHKRLENTGDFPVDIAAEALSVYGERIVQRSKRYSRVETSSSAEVTADVARQPVALLFSFAKLRAGAVGGDPHSNFLVPAHGAAEGTYLVAVPVKAYPVILIVRRDYVERAPINPKIPVAIARTPLGGYELHSKVAEGEYDTMQEYPIR
jgi:hypothetical protein